MEKHCDKMKIFAYRMAERLYDIDLMLTMDHPGDSGLFTDAIMLSQALQDRLELIGFYYEHKAHLP